ncbi:MAG: hypothetical protein ACI4MY_00225 [Christensenellales bacterium]
MTVKQFFKSSAFKCILVLTCIALIAGGVLAILNDVLYVSDEERTQQAIKKIYGQAVEYQEVTVSEEKAVNEYGTIDKVYKLSDGNYLFKSTGTEGYKGGTVTLWIVANFDGDTFKGLDKVKVAGNEKQTLMSSFKSSFTDFYTDNDDLLLEGYYFDKVASEGNIQNVTSGATRSSNAFNRAVNCTLYFIRNDMEVAR